MGLAATLAAPSPRSRPAEPCPPPIDHAHLARYTFGNVALEREVLGLFADQAPETMAWLCSAATPKSWRDAAHTLKGSARAVGAGTVAAAAEYVESLSQSTDAGLKAAAMAKLEAHLAVTCAYIRGLGPA